MSENKRSFWSTIPGFVTGLAGLLTAVVGLVTVLIQLDVIGGDNAKSSGPETTTTVGRGAGGGAATGGGATPTTDVPRFTVAPATLDFKPADPREKMVTVKNISDAAAFTISQPQVTGQDRAQFSVSTGTCGGTLRPGLSCDLRVTFAPAGPLRTYSAVLQVTAPGARGEEVRLTASTLL
ncbi:MAG: hypothetical protein M3326_16560 [Actinomycetota bacterium]|nr:hypothetical protein [Actinomycetota bacterium]